MSIPTRCCGSRRTAGALHARPAVFFAHTEEALDDLYYAEARPGRGGALLSVSWLSNLSRTAASSEEQLVRVGDHLAFVTRTEQGYSAVVVLDTRGEPEALTADWPARARLQNQISNLQQSGRSRGFGVRRYHLAEPVEALTLRARAGRFEATFGDSRLVIDPEEDAPIEGAELAEVQRTPKGMPGTISWVVDSVRAVPWIGREPIEWLEHRVFGAVDALTRARWALLGGDQEETEAQVAEDLGVPDAERERIAMLTVTDPELGWPPAAMEPVIRTHPVEGEGEWIPVVDPSFVNAYEGTPPAFYQSFIRSDPERRFARVYVTIWDPRQVQLHVMPGSAEPETASGQHGLGTIPRDPQTLRWLVAAFDGGFQALHGEFGFMSEGQLYLPPKPWAATVAVFDDGRVGMGSWPAPSWEGRNYNERAAVAQIPEDMVEMRQNLTSMVEDGRFNPWARWWWGAAPRSAQEQTYTHRSGLCLTEEGHMAFFWGKIQSADSLGAAMLAARCARAMHLDMNSAHTGLEFFRAYREGEPPNELEAPPRRDFQFDGPYPRARGWRLRARRAVRSMSMPFPRYVHTEARDFFYLTLRPVLPGRQQVEVEEGQEEEPEGHFSTEGLPHAGWPHAFARARYGEGEASSWLVRIDPRRAIPGPHRSEEHHGRVLAWLLERGGPGARGPELALLSRPSRFGRRYRVDRPGHEEDHVLLAGPPLERPAQRRRGHRRGRATASSSTPSAARIPGRSQSAWRRPESSERIALPEGARLAFSVNGHLAAPDGLTPRRLDRARSIPLYAEERPAASVIFPDTQPIPYRQWGRLQGARVRYFPESPPRFRRPPSSH